LDSKAITKIQALVLISIIVLVAASSVTVYILLREQRQPYTTIKIGILGDLDAAMGKDSWQASVLAAEQINAEGGILGREVEVIGEDTDSESGLDVVKINTALTRLITFHKVDFVVGIGGGDVGFGPQDTIAEHKKIMFSVGQTDAFTQRVLDDYDKYKYFFRVNFNHSSAFQGITDGLVLLREQTGFNKVGYLGEDVSGLKGIMEGLDYVLPEVYSFDLVYKGAFPPGTVDFSSYFAAAEASGVEVLVPLIVLDDGIPFTKEWYDRASPLLVYGGVLLSASDPESWDLLDGKCEDIAVSGLPLSVGYPMTTKTLSAREAYIDRWGSTPGWIGALFYDTIRFILPDAITRAGTIETEAVIEELEKTSIETSNARNFVFTKSHDVLVGENPNNPEADFMLAVYFQWQNGEMVPVYPKKIMEEAGATLTFPDWPGPWDE
jgi:branched-chain amino acid transport system substrate-binding protein